MPRYYSDDDDESRTPRIVDNPSDREFEKYLADFSSFIHHTKCSICNKPGPCLPVHLPFFLQQVFVCAECVYIIHQQLACVGYFEQLMNQDIREGKVRELGGEQVSADYVNVEPISSVPQDDTENIPLHVDDDVIEEYELTPCIVDHDNPGPQYEAGYFVVDFSRFSLETSFFADPPEKSVSPFVSEVFMRRKCFPDGSCKWVDLVPVNDPIPKQSFMDEYFTGTNPSRLYRGSISFSVCFSHSIDGRDSLKNIRNQLTDLINAVKHLQAWLVQDKANIYQTSTSPAIIDFLPSVDIFPEVLKHPGISYHFDEDEIITLAQDASKSEK